MLLLKRIDDIPDRRLVTAMRAERKHLNRLADFKRIKPGPRLSSSSL